MSDVKAFVGGVLFGTVGIAILTSREAKKVYTHLTAAALRGKDRVMEQVDFVRENCDDIYQDALALNEQYAAEEEAEFIADWEDELAEDLEEAAEEEPEESHESALDGSEA